MKRPEYLVTLETVSGDRISQGTKYAFNSAVRTSEALARDYARSIGRMLVGDRAQRVGNTYSRVWRNGDVKAIATVRGV